METQSLISPRAKLPGTPSSLYPVENFRQERRQVDRGENASLSPGVHVQLGLVSPTRSSATLTQQNERPSTPLSPTGSLLCSLLFWESREFRHQLRSPGGPLPTSRTCRDPGSDGLPSAHRVLIDLSSSLQVAASADNPLLATGLGLQPPSLALALSLGVPARPQAVLLTGLLGTGSFPKPNPPALF